MEKCQKDLINVIKCDKKKYYTLIFPINLYKVAIETSVNALKTWFTKYFVHICGSLNLMDGSVFRRSKVNLKNKLKKTILQN